MDRQQFDVVFFVVFSHKSVLSIFNQLNGDIFAQYFIRVCKVDSQITVAHVVAQYPKQTFAGVGVDVFEVFYVKSVAEDMFEERFGEVDFE